MTEKIVKTYAERRQQLTPEQYAVLRQQAPKRPFTGEYVHNKAKGVYTCAACELPLFESGTGWPSFWDAIEQGNVELKVDNSHGMCRVEQAKTAAFAA